MCCVTAGKKTSERGTVVEWMIGCTGLILQTVTAGKKTSERGNSGGVDDGLYLIDIADSDGWEEDL
jgi:hypothetical protein